MKRFSIVAGDFVTSGGMDRANYALANYLANTGHHVDVVGYRIAAELKAHTSVTVHQIAKPLDSYFFGQWPLARTGKKVCRTVADDGGRGIVNGGNCRFADVNWVHYVHAAHRPNARASVFYRLKQWVEHPLNLRLEREALTMAKVVICNSKRTQRDVVDLVGVPEARTRVIYYGTDADQFLPSASVEKSTLRHRLDFPSGRPAVVFVGALGDRRKGFDTLFDAWSTLCRSTQWDAMLLVVGIGAELATWKQRAVDAGMADSIRFLGFRTDVPDILRAADLLVAPTRYEAYGLGVQEALCCGLPAVVTASAGIAERYPSDLSDLLLPDPNDSADLTARLLQWRRDLEGLQSRVAPLSKSLRSYSWNDMSRDILTAIGELSPSDRDA